MSDKEEGSLSHSENGSIDGSLKGSGSPAESGRLTRSRSVSPASRKSNASPGSRRSPASPRSRSRSRSFRRGVYRSRSRSRSRGRKYYSRSRSRSPHYGHRRRSRYSRRSSRSRSPYYDRYSYYSDRRGRYQRSRSRSPMSRRRRHVGTRDNPKEGRCVGIFGLSLYTQERDLREVFSRYGPLEDVQVVYDHQTGRSRGFAFVYFRSTDDALEAKERATGTEIDGRRIRVDYSITERAHTPTPGIYLGKPTPGYRSGGGGGGSSYGRRSPSPYYSNRKPGRYSRSRSRSRSYTPPSRRY